LQGRHRLRRDDQPIEAALGKFRAGIVTVLWITSSLPRNTSRRSPRGSAPFVSKSPSNALALLRAVSISVSSSSRSDRTAPELRLDQVIERQPRTVSAARVYRSQTIGEQRLGGGSM